MTPPLLQPPSSFPASLAELVSSADVLVPLDLSFAVESSSSSSWAHDFSPTTSTDLAVHPKKVSEVREWLEAQQRASCRFPPKHQQQLLLPPPPRLLIVSGPPGCGKSTTVRVLASELGFDVLEWVAPLPTLWDEHAHLNSSGFAPSGLFSAAAAPGGGGSGYGVRSSGNFTSSAASASASAAPYQSKLDAFEAFVAGCRLAPLELLQSRSSGGPTGATTTTTTNALAPPPPPTFSAPRPRLALVRDLPHASGAEARRRLASALVALCRGSRGPAVLITTNAGGRAGASGGSASSSHSSSLAGSDAAMGLDGGLHRELADAAAAAGAVSIAFNPATAAATAKALLRAAEKAGGLPLGSARAAALAGAAGGDLRTALLGAQLAVAGEQQKRNPTAAAARAPAGGGNNRKRSRAAAAASMKAKNNDPALPAGAVESAAALASRDAGIGAMHALGKILHNKRDWEGWLQRGLNQHGGGSLQRPLLDSDPEEAVASAGLDASSSAAFLFENLPLFVQGEEALRDAASAAEYLAQSDVINCSCSFARGGGGGSGGGGSGNNFAEAAAAAVAARGVAFSRARPAPKGWISLRGPLAGIAARAAASNAERLRGGGGGGGGEETTAGGASTTAAAAAAAPLPLAALASSSREAAATLLPALRSLAAKDPRKYGVMLPEAWERLWQGKVVVERPRQNANGGGSAVAAAAAAAVAAAEESGRMNGEPDDGDDAIENDDDDF